MHVGPMSVCNVIDSVIYLDDEIVMLNLGEEMEGSVGGGKGRALLVVDISSTCLRKITFNRENSCNPRVQSSRLVTDLLKISRNNEQNII